MRTKFKLLALCTATVVTAAPSYTQAEVEVWLTRGDQTKLLSSENSLSFVPGSGATGNKINIDADTGYQTMSGFGAAMTDSSAWLIQNEVTAPQRNALMNQLFSPTTGIGISYLRVPVGASDLSLNPYTYNDQSGNHTDPDQSDFSISHDQSYIIPTLQQAKAINPQLAMMASPWSAPAWMKTNNSLIGGSLQGQYYGSYADYFVKFFQGYEAAGLPFDTMTVQNEPQHGGNHPSMTMNAWEQATFIGDHLGPELAAAGIDTEIIAFDHNWDNWDYPVTVMDDPEARTYATGAAFHGYGGSVGQQSDFQMAHPDKDIYFSEQSGGIWAPNYSDNLMYFTRDIVIGATRNWAKTSILWNIALDENNGPYLNGGCGGCRGVVTINTADGSVQKNEEYYSIAHASKFVKPGAVRIDTDTIDNVIETVGFVNPDGSRVLIAVNPADISRSFDVVEDSEAFSYQLTAKSVATFVWPGDPLLGTDDPFVNPGFDNGTLQGWLVYGNEVANVSASSEATLDGTSHALKLYGQFDGSENTSGAAQGVPVTEGQEVTADARAFIRSQDTLSGKSNEVFMKLEYYSLFGADHGSADFLGEEILLIADGTTAEDVWLPHQILGTAPSSAAEARLSFLFRQPGFDNGAIFIDGTAITAIDPVLIGDLNGDGFVGILDLNLILGAWNATITPGAAVDPSGDGFVGIQDLNIILGNWNAGTPPAAAIPEPATLGLIALGSLAMFRRRQDRKQSR